VCITLIPDIFADLAYLAHFSCCTYKEYLDKYSASESSSKFLARFEKYAWRYVHDTLSNKKEGKPILKVEAKENVQKKRTSELGTQVDNLERDEVA